MRPYEVEYTRTAEGQLARLWLLADDPQAAAIASNAIDALLALDPRGNTRELTEGLHEITRHPIRAYCEIDDDKRKVLVTAVGHLRSPAAGA